MLRLHLIMFSQHTCHYIIEYKYFVRILAAVHLLKITFGNDIFYFIPFAKPNVAMYSVTDSYIFQQ